MGLAKGAQILSAFELARRHLLKETMKIVCAKDALPLMADIAAKPQEHFLCISLNGANEVIEKRVISIGLADRSSVHPREVFADAVADRASGIIVAHNHPAGSLEPSAADTDVTRQLKAAGECLGIHLVDHIIFNRSGYFSFLESGLL